jgi:hypothetical protein
LGDILEKSKESKIIDLWIDFNSFKPLIFITNNGFKPFFEKKVIKPSVFPVPDLPCKRSVLFSLSFSNQLINSSVNFFYLIIFYWYQL